ncbi:MAG: ABC transporter substrate-binding protein [Acidimicrobiales bacterium]
MKVNLHTRWRRGALALSLCAAASLAALSVAPVASSAATRRTASQDSASQLAAKTSNSKYGGVLYMLGSGDVDYMDPNVTYYTVGYEAMRMFSRSILNYPATPGKTTDVVPDLATSMPTVSDNGLVYTVTIRKGAMWNTNPPRQVTGADAKLGLERTCNPQEPFGGVTDFEFLVSGMKSFCAAFLKVKPTVANIKAFLASHSISGVTAAGDTVSYKLVHPTSYFNDLLALEAFNPAPAEDLNYLPASAAFAQHTVSDGPYEIQSYNPTRSIVFVRNPDWKASTDPISKAYVNEIKVSETVSATSVQQQLETNSTTAELAWGDTPIPPAQLPHLIAGHNAQVVIGSTYGLDPYLLFNQMSPNENKAMANVKIRQAISYAIDRSALNKDAGGPVASPALTQLLAPSAIGYSNFDDYPYNPSKAKSVLEPLHLKLKFLYQADNPTQVKMFQTIQFELSQVGVSVSGVGVPQADIYAKYYEVPTVAKGGTWDLGFAQWFPDWYGANDSDSFLQPTYDADAFPPAGSDFGFENDAKVNAWINEAIVATTTSQAAKLWSDADHQIMADAAAFPINDPTFDTYYANQVHNAVFVPQIQAIDPTNVWLSPSNRQNG